MCVCVDVLYCIMVVGVLLCKSHSMECIYEYCSTGSKCLEGKTKTLEIIYPHAVNASHKTLNALSNKH